VVAHAQDDEPSRRLLAEAGALGLDVLDLRVAADDARTTAALAEVVHARAALRITREGIDLVVLAANGGALDLSVLVTAQGARDTTAPLRAIEALRARLVKLTLLPAEAAQAEAAPEQAPAREANRAAVAPHTVTASAGKDAAGRIDAGAPNASSALQTRSPPPRLWLGASIGGVTSAGGLGAEAQAGAHARLEVSARVRASALALFALSKLHVASQPGTVDVAVSLLSALGAFALLPARSPVEVELGAGAGAALFRVAGRTTEPAFSARSTTLVAPVALASASFGFLTARWLRVHVDVLGGLAVLRPTVRIDGERVAAWGQPFATALLAFDLGALSLRGGSE
jgi:hypothetical protein